MMEKRNRGNVSIQKSENYLHGNTVRKLQSVPRREERDSLQRDAKLRNHARRNREKALQMNPGYVLFLAIATVITLVVCINYLKLQSDITNKISKISSLESELADLQSQNNEEYNKVATSVDLEYIKNVAISELGMIYAGEEQVILYDSKDSDYVRQYEDIPKEESSGLLGMLH